MNYLIIGGGSKITYGFIQNVINLNKKNFFFLTFSSYNNLKKFKNKKLYKLNKKIFYLTVLDLSLRNLNLKRITDIILKKITKIDTIYLIAGKSNFKQGFIKQSLLEKLININCLNIIKLLNFLINHMRKNVTEINFISTVAAIRPRKKNNIYSISKIMLENYLSSLDHLFEYKNPIKIIRLGYVENSSLLSTSYKKISNFLLNCSSYKKSFAKYFPFYWVYIAVILKLMPKFLFKKVNL
jgi:short-subunit dehydrogenase